MMSPIYPMAQLIIMVTGLKLHQHRLILICAVHITGCEMLLHMNPHTSNTGTGFNEIFYKGTIYLSAVPGITKRTQTRWRCRGPNTIIFLSNFRSWRTRMDAEGTAQYQRQQMGYDYWDAHRDMILRMCVLGDTCFHCKYMAAKLLFEVTT